MNYRHAFHAGNFADVVKHVVLVRVLVHLGMKPTPYRVIDTHAGAGCYDLLGPEAVRSGEWHAGIGRLLGASLDGAAAALLAPYLDAVKACNPPGRLITYPGSPAIAREFLRAQDRLVACELEPGAAATLARHLGHDRRIKVLNLDGWTALNAYVPPKERRGLVLIDPPYEDAADLQRAVTHLQAAYRKWANGIFLLWYPVTQRAGSDALARDLRRSGIARILCAELMLGPAAATSDTPRLAGCGLVVVNPPWKLDQELAVSLQALAAALSEGGGEARIVWFAGEHGP